MQLILPRGTDRLMERGKMIIATAAVAGLTIGLIGSFAIADSSGSSYCDSIQQQIKANQSFNGSAACYPPGVIDVNISDKVDENTDLRCVCRIIDSSGNTQILPVAVSR